LLPYVALYAVSSVATVRCTLCSEQCCYRTLHFMYKDISGSCPSCLTKFESRSSSNWKTLFTESDDTRGCSNTICPPEDEQGAARNMLRIVM